MFRSKLATGAIALALMFLIGVFGAWASQASTTAVTASPAPFAQGAGGDNPAGVTAPDASTWVNCTANSVGVFSNRIHVRCNESYSGIRYFAYPATTAAAARYLSVLASAQVSGHLLQVLYDPADTSGTAYGCAASNCRPIQGIALY